VFKKIKKLPNDMCFLVILTWEKKDIADLNMNTVSLGRKLAPRTFLLYHKQRGLGIGLLKSIASRKKYPCCGFIFVVII
jgi:hypothetical protein